MSSNPVKYVLFRIDLFHFHPMTLLIYAKKKIPSYSSSLLWDWLVLFHHYPFIFLNFFHDSPKKQNLCMIFYPFSTTEYIVFFIRPGKNIISYNGLQNLLQILSFKKSLSLPDSILKIPAFQIKV